MLPNQTNSKYDRAALADILRAIGRLITRHWPTYYTRLADLLHAIGRLITRQWPTYYTPLADLLHADWTRDATHFDDTAGSPGVPGNQRVYWPRLEPTR